MKSPQVKDNTTDWESYLEFRVVLPDVRQVKSEGEIREVSGIQTAVPILIFGGAGIVVLIVIMIATNKMIRF